MSEREFLFVERDRLLTESTTDIGCWRRLSAAAVAVSSISPSSSSPSSCLSKPITERGAFVS